MFTCSLSTTLIICVLLCILFPSSFHINCEYEWMLNVSECLNWDSLEVQWLPSNAGAVGLIPGWGAKARYALGPKNQNRSSILTNSVKTLKMVHIKITFKKNLNQEYLSSCCLVSKSHLTLVDPMNCSPPNSSVISRQEYWSGLPFPSTGNLPDPGNEPMSLCLLHCRRILYH